MKPARPDVVITPGHPGSTVILHVAHAGTAIPADVRVGIDLHDDALRHAAALASDAPLDGIARSAAYRSRPTPTTVVAELSRLVIDTDGGWTTPRRNPPPTTAVLTTARDGTSLRTDDTDEHAAITTQHLEPYREQTAALIAEIVGRCGRCMLIDLHASVDGHGITVAINGDERGVEPFTRLGQELGLEVARDDNGVAAPLLLTPTTGLTTVRVELPRALLRRGSPQARAAAVALSRCVDAVEVEPHLDDYRRTTIQLPTDAPIATSTAHVITAQHPFSQPQDAETNRKNNGALREALLAAGAVVVPARAGAADWWEDSFWVEGIDRDQAVALGRRFEQHAVFEIAEGRVRVIGCTTGEVLADDPLVVERRSDHLAVHASMTGH